MELANPRAEVYVPDGRSEDEAVARTTHMAIGAHPDDIPIMAQHGITHCFRRTDEWFLGVTVTDGARSPRAGAYADYTDEQMRAVRLEEERKAASVGEYGAAVLLDHSSSTARDPDTDVVTADLASLIEAASPGVVYTHDLADRHDTHVAVALRTIAAIRRLAPDARPGAVHGCEVWRDLDWMTAEDRIAFDVTAHGNLAMALIGLYDSQVSGGKRYDLAAAGRRLSHATFSAHHAVDTAQALSFAMDLTPMIDLPIDPATFVTDHIDRMRREITDRIGRLS